MTLSPALKQILDTILASQRRPLTLDALADAIGMQAVSPADIDALMAALEERGIEVAAPEPGAVSADLTQVLATARLLRVELGRKPSALEIASRSGLEHTAVRAALLFARVMSR